MKSIIKRFWERNKGKYVLYGFGMSSSLIRQMEQELNIRIGERW